MEKIELLKKDNLYRFYCQISSDWCSWAVSVSKYVSVDLIVRYYVYWMMAVKISLIALHSCLGSDYAKSISYYSNPKKELIYS